MATINPRGHDQTTGQEKIIAPGDTLTPTGDGAGGDLTIRSGDASSGSGLSGGSLTLRSGESDQSGGSGTSGGDITITASDGDAGSGGNITITAGDDNDGSIGSGGSVTITSGAATGIDTGGSISLTTPSSYFAGGIGLTAAAGGPGGDGYITLCAPYVNLKSIAGGGFGTELTTDIQIDDTGGTINIGTMNDPTINIGNADMASITAGRGAIGTGDDTNGLILIDRGGTRIGELTGSPITLGPVYYDPNNGMRIRFGSSIFLDGDGTVNTINGRDATVDNEEVLTKIGDTDATASLASIGPISDTPLTPGSVTLQVVLASAPTTFATVTDDGAGAFPSGSVLPAGGTITYATGAMTGTTATLESTSQVVAFYLMDDASGEALTPRGGDGVGAGDGGNLDLQGGEGGATGDGGDILITSGVGGSTSGDSGNVNISAGSVTSGTPGTVQVNSLPLPTVLAQVTSIDLTSTGTTSLFTVPTGLSARILGLVISPTTATAAGGDAVVSVGTNASTFDDIISATTLTGLSATTEIYNVNTPGISHVAAAGETITFQVDTGDTGTALTATVELIGYLR